MRTCLQVHSMDLAGSPYRMESAINDFMVGWRALRVQEKEPFEMGFPRGLPWSKLGELSEQADVVHIHHLYFAHQVIPKLSGKPKIVVSVRGTPDRERETPVPKGAHFLHSCHWDLLETYPKATVIPNFVLTKDVGHHAPLEILQSEKIRVFQPVAHALKHPKEFLKVKEHFALADPNKVDFVSQPGRHCRVKNSDQLSNMSKCHISWDNLQGNFGNNSIEAIALGLLPITSFKKATTVGLCKFFGVSSATLPYHFKGGFREIIDTLLNFSNDIDTLEEWRYRAFCFWEDRWRDEHMIAKWREVYEGLL